MIFCLDKWIFYLPLTTDVSFSSPSSLYVAVFNPSLDAFSIWSFTKSLDLSLIMKCSGLRINFGILSVQLGITPLFVSDSSFGISPKWDFTLGKSSVPGIVICSNVEPSSFTFIWENVSLNGKPRKIFVLLKGREFALFLKHIISTSHNFFFW